MNCCYVKAGKSKKIDEAHIVGPKKQFQSKHNTMFLFTTTVNLNLLRS